LFNVELAGMLPAFGVVTDFETKYSFQSTGIIIIGPWPDWLVLLIAKKEKSYFLIYK